jgi:glycosyltransferase involved in cell wall biosynthesis
MGWDITLWEPTLSPHKTGLVAALALHPAVSRVRMVAHADIAPQRKLQGWSSPAIEGGNLFVGLSDEEIVQMFAEASSNSVHIITGMRGSRTIKTALRAAARYKRRYAIMSEPRVSEGISGILRLAQSLLFEERLRRTAGFVLAIGAHGPRWFAKTGYRKATIFPFAYFLPNSYPSPDRRLGPPTIVSYLGRLEREKGIDTFVDVVPKLPDMMHARVAGHGSQEEFVRRSVEVSGGRLRYYGVLAMADVPNYLDETDILVVPSRSTNDGWAAVVSEALMHGVAIVASDKVGASILLQDMARGEAVQSENSAAIIDAVQRLWSSNRLTQEARQARSAWANERLSATGGADYLTRILSHIYEGKGRPPPFFD